MQTVYDFSPKCCIPSVKAVNPVVLEKFVFKIFTVSGHGGYLGDVTWTNSANFHSAIL